MFEKKMERILVNNKYSKVYLSNLSILQIYDMINQEEFPIKKIKFSDDADVSLKSFGCEVTPEEFYANYAQYSAFINSIDVFFENNSLFITIFDNGTLSIISNANIELESIIKKKVETKQF